MIYGFFLYKFHTIRLSNTENSLLNTREFRIMYSTSLENMLRTLFIWTNVDKREEVSEAIWPLKVRFESNVTPRSLTEITGTRTWPRKGTVMLLGNLEISCFTPNRTTLVKLGETCLTKTQPCCTSYKPCCTGDAGVFATAGLWNLFRSNMTLNQVKQLWF